VHKAEFFKFPSLDFKLENFWVVQFDGIFRKQAVLRFYRAKIFLENLSEK